MICEFCGKNMSKSRSCLRVPYMGLDPIPCTEEKCHDCNVTKGNFHHRGCDMERCPKCKGQLISCGCYDEK